MSVSSQRVPSHTARLILAIAIATGVSGSSLPVTAVDDGIAGSELDHELQFRRDFGFETDVSTVMALMADDGN